MTKKGFTLVEIMVAVILLALLATGLFSTMVSARYLVARSRARVMAVEIARGEIEKKRGLIDVVSWGQPEFNPNGVWRSWDTTSHPPYRVRYRVDPSSGDYKKVTFQVAWDEAHM